MRIVLMFLGRRGAGPVYSYSVAQALANYADVMVVLSRQVENRADWYRLPGIRVEEIDTVAAWPQVLRKSPDVCGYVRIRDRIREFCADVAYIPMVSPFALPLCLLTKKLPRVITIHDPVAHLGDRNPATWVLRKAALRLATRIVVLSRQFVPVLEGQGIPASRIDVIPHGQFGYYRDKVRSSGAVTQRRPTLLFFGRIEPYKGIDVLLRAFKTVKASVPAARLQIVGSGNFGPYRALAAEVSDVEVVNRWIPDNEVGTYFLEAEAVVLPYFEGTQSGVIAIAAAFGTPVIASDVGGIGEQVIDGVSGCLVPPGDVTALAHSCVRILRDRELRLLFADGARRDFDARASWDNVARLVRDSCARAIA